MRKHFLILMLLTLLPLATWATKAEPTTMPTLKSGLVYNGSEQELTTGSFVLPSDYPASLKVKFLIQKPTDPDPTEFSSWDEWSTAAVSMKNAGTYSVWYFVEKYATGGYNEDNIAKLGNVIIDKATIKSTDYTAPTVKDMYYYGDASQFALNAGEINPEIGTFYYNRGSGPYATTIPGAKWGSFKYHWYIKGSENYYDLGSETHPEGEIVNKVKKGIVTLGAESWGAENVTYNSTAQVLIGTEPTHKTRPQGTSVAYIDVAGTFTYTVSSDMESSKTYVAAAEATGTKAGNYIITYKFTPTDAEHYDVVEGDFTAPVSIAKAQYTLSKTPVPVAGLVYNHADLELLSQGCSRGSGMPAGQVWYYINGDKEHPIDGSAYANVKGKDVGEYSITWSVNAKDEEEAKNWEPAVSTSPVVATIGKRGLDIAAQSVNVPYGTEVKASDLIKADDTDFAGETDEEKAAIIEALVGFAGGWTIPTSAGTHNFTLEPKTAANYEINNFVADGVLNISKATNTVTVTMAGWQYGKTATDPVVTATFDDDKAKFEYYTEEDVKLGEDKPVNAGKYYVKATIDGTDNFDAATAKSEVFEITKADLAITVKDATKEYGAEEPALELDAIPEYKNGDDAEKIGLTIEREEGENVGEYAITATIANGGNYNITNTPGKFTITKAALAIKVANAGKLYGAEDPALELAAAPEYKNSDDAEKIGLTIERVAGEGVGSYDITATVNELATKNYDITFTKGEFTISAAELTLTAVNATKTYGDAEPTLTATAEGLQNEETLEDLGLEVTREAGEDVGTYKITATLTKAGNYLVNAVDGTFEITKKQVTPFAPTALAPEYKGIPQNLINAGTCEGAEKIEYAIYKDETEVKAYSTDMPQAINAGLYTVKYRFTADANHSIASEVAEGEVFAKITKASIGYQILDQVVTYTGKAFAPEAEKSFKQSAGDFLSTDGYGKTFTFAYKEGVETTNAGAKQTIDNFEIVWAEEGVENYSIEITKEGSLTIEPAEIAVTAPTAAEGLKFNYKDQALLTAAASASFDEKPFEFAYKLNDAATEFDAITGNAAGDYTIAWNVTDESGNFKFEPANGEITVNIAAAEAWNAKVAAFAEGDIEKTYSGENFATTFEATDFLLADGETVLTPLKDYTVKLNGEAVTDITAVDITNAATYTLTYEGLGNYAGLSEDFAIVVNQKNIADEDVAISGVPDDLKYKKDDQLENVALALTFNEKTLVVADGENENDYVLTTPDKMINAGKYTFTFEGKGNFTGTKTQEVEIAKLQLIATAPNAVKTYDGTNTVEFAEFAEGGIQYSGLLAGDKIDLGEGKTIADFLTIDAEAINAKESAYEGAIKISGEFPEQTNYEIASSIDGNLTINKAAAIKVGFAEGTEFTGKTYDGVADDTEVAETYNIAITAGEAFGEDADAIKAATTAVRAEGADVAEYDVTLTIDETAEVFANYEGVSFDEATTAKFPITPYAETLKISVANLSKTYDGVEVSEIEITADNLVVKEGKPVSKESIFEVLPTAKIKGDAALNAGEYNIELTGGESKNYTFELLPATYTIDPIFVNAKFNNKPVVHTGAAAADVKAMVDWSIVADDEESQAVVDAEIDLFELQFNAGVVEDDKIATDDGKNALVIAYIGGNDNYEFVENPYGDLAIGGVAGDIELNDADEVSVEANEGTYNVTFTQSRGITVDTWQAAVLPVTVSVEDFSKAFGYAVVDFLDMSKTTADEIHFSAVTDMIPAGTPFLFRPNGTKANFNEVTIENCTMPKSTADIVADGDNVVEHAATGVKFIGTFETENITTAGYRYISKGKWYDTADGKAKPYVIKPLRAYLDLTALGSSAAPRIVIENGDGTYTSIDRVTFENTVNGAEGWYTVNGMKLDKAPAEKGVYIKDGKKVVIK